MLIRRDICYFIVSVLTVYLLTGFVPVNGQDEKTPLRRTLSLSEGWNLISLPLIPVDSSVTAVLSGIGGFYTSVLIYDASDTDQPWRSYHPEKPDFLNSLQTLDHTMGIWIDMKEEGELTIEGFAAGSTHVELVQGWNLIGFPSLSDEYLSSVSGDLIKNRDVYLNVKKIIEIINNEFILRSPQFLILIFEFITQIRIEPPIVYEFKFDLNNDGVNDIFDLFVALAIVGFKLESGNAYWVYFESKANMDILDPLFNVGEQQDLINGRERGRGMGRGGPGEDVDHS